MTEATEIEPGRAVPARTTALSEIERIKAMLDRFILQFESAEAGCFMDFEDAQLFARDVRVVMSLVPAEAVASVGPEAIPSGSGQRDDGVEDATCFIESFKPATLRDEMAMTLFKAWVKADPRSGVSRHPASYLANFVDMAEAVIAAYPSESAGSAAATTPASAAEDDAVADKWRELALQFDRHRIATLSVLRAVAAGTASPADCAKFLALPPPAPNGVRVTKLVMPNGDTLECASPGDSDWATSWDIRYADTGEIGTTVEQDWIVEKYGLTAVLNAALAGRC